ncbi:MAG: DUF1800 domain-containing protein [Rhodomicrobium sp.]
MDVLDFPLSRLCYAAHPEDAEEVQRAGLPVWASRQLDLNNANGAGLKERLGSFKLQIKYAAGNGQPAPNGDLKNWPAVDEMRPLGYLDAPVASAWTLLGPKPQRPGEEQMRPYQEVACATIIRAVHSRAQLYERMVGFWHDHFNVLATDDRRIGCALPAYDRDAIRVHALGNFRDMLEAVAASPAMLVYLSNASSRAGGDNENFARELLELHTLGRDAYLNGHYDRWRDVPGAAEGKPAGYIDEDVYEAARAFTGWTIETGQRLDSATELPRTGKFVYIDSWHDGYQKRVLAKEFPPFAPPMADGRKVLDLAAFHPATARFLCLKLCRTFVSDSPPQSLVESAAKVWMENAKKPSQIAAVVKHIVLSKEFAASRGLKPRSPLALAASFARAAGIDLVPTMPLVQQLAQCGQRLYGWPSPDGRPTSAAYYLTPDYMRERWVLVTRLAGNAWNNGQPEALALAANGGGPRAGEFVARWLTRFAGPGAAVQPFLAALGVDPALPVRDEKRLAQIAGICAAAPQFQMT